MKIAVLADIHATINHDCLQWKALEEAVYMCVGQYVDVIVFAGDLIMPGAEEAARDVRNFLNKIPYPMVFTMGNNEEEIPDYAKRFPYKNSFVNDEIEIYAIEAERPAPNGRPRMIFGHYPMDKSPEEGALYVAGHSHYDKADGMAHIVRGQDPDKAIGGPGIAIFSCEDGVWSRKDLPLKSFTLDDWTAEDRKEFSECLGVSVKHDTDDMLAEITRAGIRNVEFLSHLEPSEKALDEWKRIPGWHISVHLPDLTLEADTEAIANTVRRWTSCGASQFTVHVPKALVEVLAEPENMEKMLGIYETVIRSAPQAVWGIENMHMTAKDTLEHRRFGYIPEEQTQFIELLRTRMPKIAIGPLLDIGHARNNAPFSSKYNLSDWYRRIGGELVGMHIHQIVTDDSGYHNHHAFRGLFTRLISLASLLYSWRTGALKRCPLFIETDEDWKISYDTFSKLIIHK